ncbi:MAG: hypothetical protein JO307_20415 [Bryobacterales bacterium]|nr:hypothetical protein [Bryobacterales bacterium]MBV9396444.1 hypothetical protein [Bryobacterales bacterium]
MSQFLLLLHADPTVFQKLSPEQREKTVEKYMAWTKKPFAVDSKRLAAEPGRVIRASNGQPKVTDGPYSETKEVLGGFYLIEAASYEDAVKKAMDHPHLENGTIEVRELYRM